MDKANCLRIAITLADISDDEHRRINEILDTGYDFVHLRHPDASLRDMRNLIEQIAPRHHCRLRLHGHFELLNSFNLGGIHLNRRCPTAPAGYHGTITRSCHSIDEVVTAAPSCLYVTLSPIFDSISKPGYKAASFTDEELMSLPADKVIALGGITPDNITRLQPYPFAGYAMSGHLFLK